MVEVAQQERVAPRGVKIGDRVRLIRMPEDFDPIPVGTEGIVTGVQYLYFMGKGEWTISVDWDIDRWLNMLCPPDEFEIIPNKYSNCAREDEPRRNWCLACIEDRYEDCSHYGPETE